jgi:hypothetical protein
MLQENNMEFPETVLTTGKRGKLEIRTLESRGRYVICKYLDPETMKLADAKRKLMLFDEDGRTLEYFIVPFKDSKRSLLIPSLPDAREKQIWNETQGRPEEI